MKSQTAEMTFASLPTLAMNISPKTWAARLALACCSLLLVLSTFTVLAPKADAQAAPNPVALAAQVMMQTQSDDAVVLANRFGLDPNSKLQYDTYIDSLGQKFAIAVRPGSTYLGQPLTLNVTAALDSQSKTWNISSAGQLGPNQWTVISTITISAGENSQVTHFKSESQVASKTLLANLDTIDCNGVIYHVSSTNDLNAHGNAPCLYYWSAYPNNKYPFAAAFSQDNSGHDRNTNWSWSANSFDGAFSFVSTGFYPVDGGQGSFSSLLAPGQPGCISCGSAPSQ